jgi:NADH-quinone oxidoreductase subunit M
VTDDGWFGSESDGDVGMALIGLIVVLLVGGLLAWLAERWSSDAPRRVAVAVLVLDLAWLILLWMEAPAGAGLWAESVWFEQVRLAWIPQWGISFHLAMDGLGLLMSLLTVFLGLMAVAGSRTEIRARTGFYYFNLLWVLAGVLGVFTALDLFLFFVFWEVMLVPMVFLIALWGHRGRTGAAIKFFIYTQGSGLLLLVAILSLVFLHHAASGRLTFDYLALREPVLASSSAAWMMLGFFIAFAVKLPAVPFHPWLPDAHTQAPTGGSVILAGVLLKTGAYGLIRFVVPLFPQASAAFAPVAMTLGVVGILYGAVLAFVQSDLKRLVAYSSVSHMGFVLLGVFSFDALALQGAVMQMIAHGIATGALFMVAGSLQERLHTREMGRMGGLWDRLPRTGAIALLFAIASLGLPGFGNFVGEFLVLLGTYRVSPAFAGVAVLGPVAAVLYALALVQRTFHGTVHAGVQAADYSARETAVMGVMAGLILLLGLYPQPVLEMLAPALQALAGSPAVHAALAGGLP